MCTAGIGEKPTMSTRKPPSAIAAIAAVLAPTWISEEWDSVRAFMGNFPSKGDPDKKPLDVNAPLASPKSAMPVGHARPPRVSTTATGRSPDLRATPEASTHRLPARASPCSGAVMGFDSLTVAGAVPALFPSPCFRGREGNAPASRLTRTRTECRPSTRKQIGRTLRDLAHRVKIRADRTTAVRGAATAMQDPSERRESCVPVWSGLPLHLATADEFDK